MPAPLSAFGVPSEVVAPLTMLGGGLLLTMVTAVLARVVRGGLTRAGLMGPTKARPGIDWARVAGLLAGGLVFVVLLPSILGDEGSHKLRISTQRIAESIYPLFGSLLALAIGAHHQRVLLGAADSARGLARDALVARAERVEWISMVIAAVVLVGEGLWAAWPLGVAAAVVFALRDERVRPVLDRWAADLTAGHRLRKTHLLKEGAAVSLAETTGLLAGPVGPLDVRVAVGENIVLMRNTELLNSLVGVQPTQLEAPDPTAE